MGQRPTLRHAGWWGGVLLLAVLAATPLPTPAHTPSGRDGAVIEDFESGTVSLSSYPGQDEQPGGWRLDSLVTHAGSAYALRLSGNTWKIASVPALPLDSGDVWSVHALVEQTGEIQGFGLRDSLHEILFSFAGSEELDPGVWTTVYQGAFPTGVWNESRLPVADAWLSRYGYLPCITGLVFVNDRDTDPTSVIVFDDILDVTADLPHTPVVSITHTAGVPYRDAEGTLDVDVDFTSHVTDPDSGQHTYLWRFGDGSTGTEPHPHHTFTAVDDHAYRVLLEVTDATGRTGRATCMIVVDAGPSSFPLSLTFVGDVMLARNYEAPGGIIPTQGVQAIFAPTLADLGEAAQLTVANLECPLTQSGTPHPTKPIVFRGSPANAAGLAYAGIDLVSLANNHVMDYGLAGLQETQSTLRQNGIAFSGAGAHAAEAYEPVFLSRSGCVFGFLAFSDRTGQYNNYQPYLDAGENKPGFANLTRFELSRRIADIRNDADIVVVEMHSGSEYSTVPLPPPEASEAGDEDYTPHATAPLDSDREIRRLALDAGADLVVCHHPHITQGFEVHNGKLIAHSLGNFAFDLSYAETFPSVILRAEANAERITGCTVTPVYIDDYIPRRARGDLGIHILDDLARKSRELGATLVVDRTAVTGRILLDTTAVVPHCVTRAVTAPLTPAGGLWTSPPVRLARSGSLRRIAALAPAGSWSVRYGRDALWMGNFEDEGSTLWNLDSGDERYDTAASHNGLRSLRQRRTSAAGALTTNLEGRLTAAPGAAYGLCTWIRTSNARDAGMTVRFYNSRTAFSEIGSGNLGGDIDGTSDWTFLAGEVTAPAGTTFLDVEFSSSGPSSGTGYAWFDDAAIIEWSAWTTPGEDLLCPNDYSWIQVRTAAPVTAAAVTYREQQYTDTQIPAEIVLPLSEGWNLLSTPVSLPDSLTAVRTLFPSSSFPHAFAFSSATGYRQSGFMPAGPGFWVKFPADGATTVTGSTRLSDTVAVERGWNILGSLSVPVDTAGLRTVPPGLFASLIFAYSGGYSPASGLTPGAGYWVKCRDSGRVIASALPDRRDPPAKRPRSPGSGMLTITDALGRSQTLFVGTAGRPLSAWELPPPPPGGGHDIRFGTGHLAVPAGADTPSTHDIVLTGVVFPLTLTWRGGADAQAVEVGSGTRSVRLRGEGSARLPEPSARLTLTLHPVDGRPPARFALAQNFPNPFNPVTTISYDVPVRSEVSLGVYSVAGQLVRVLFAGDQVPGTHTVAWDGRNDAGVQAGSGVYFARLVAGGWHGTRKLLLIR